MAPLPILPVSDDGSLVERVMERVIERLLNASYVPLAWVDDAGGCDGALACRV